MDTICIKGGRLSPSDTPLTYANNETYRKCFYF